MWTSLPFILQGLVYTSGIGFVSFVLENLVGLFLAVLGLLDWLPLNMPIRFCLSFFRDIPALVLLSLLYFGLPCQLSILTVSATCFAIISGAFIGEIYRGSLAGVLSGQWDAGLVSGLSFFGVLKHIVLPQAFRTSVPAFSNVAMDLVKDTSLVITITVPEMFQGAKIIGGRIFDYFSLYILVTLVYWITCVGIEKV